MSEDDRKVLEESIRRLTEKVKNLEKDNKRLRRENHTVMQAWERTEAKIKSMMENVPLEEAITVKSHKKVQIIKGKDPGVEICRECGKGTLSYLPAGSFSVCTCNVCDFRAKKSVRKT